MRKGHGKTFEVWCARCDKKVQASDDDKKALAGWEWRKDTGDLCPECYAEYKRVIERFLCKKRGTACDGKVNWTWGDEK